MDGVLDMLISRINYWVFIALMMIGLYGIIIKKNLMKKIIGLSILQTSIILFFISIGAKKNATIPIIEHTHDSSHTAIQAV
jgi:multicomponent Na+:H+ antiporter subunit C